MVLSSRSLFRRLLLSPRTRPSIPSRIVTNPKSLATSTTLNLQPQRTALYDFHVANGGNLVSFAGWMLPLIYSDKSHVQSHLHTRAKASLFDVSHMLQTLWSGPQVIEFLESLVVSDIQALSPGAATLSLLTTPSGGILDDLVIQRLPLNINSSSLTPTFYVVSNAACADKDLHHFNLYLEQFNRSANHDKDKININVMHDHSLLALQGPRAVHVIEQLSGQSFSNLPFMHGTRCIIQGIPTHVTRCGYTGEDGVEISVHHNHVNNLADMLLQHPDVALAGLAVRDSLRIEAGLCLYGHDLDESISPVEASLLWTIGKRRRAQANFLGAQPILSQINGPISKRRVGLIVQGPPAREGAKIINPESGQEVGNVTSGVPSPVLKKNIAMGYINCEGRLHKVGSTVGVVVRGKTILAQVTKMPFVPHQYYRK